MSTVQVEPKISIVISHLNSSTSPAEVWATVCSFKSALEGGICNEITEIIIADNAPTISNKILEQLVEHKICKVVQCAERSTAKIRNAGFAATSPSSEFIIFSDCHVLVDKGFIDRLIKTMKDTDFGILHGKTAFWPSVTPYILYDYRIDTLNGLCAVNNSKPKSLYSSYAICCGPYGLVCFRRNVFIEAGGFIDEMVGWGAEEVSLSILAMMRGHMSGLSPLLSHWHFDAAGARRHENIRISAGYEFVLNNLLSSYICGGEVWLEKNFNYWKNLNLEATKGMDLVAYELGKERREKVKKNSIMTLEDVLDFWKEFQIGYNVGDE